MKTAIVKLKSASPYSQSQAINVPRLDDGKESHDAYEHRTWRMRMHVDANGMVFIPPMALKKSLEEAAQYMSEKIPGKRNATWTKHFVAGIMVIDPVGLGIKADDVPGVWRLVTVNGQKGGSGPKVWRCFPEIESWEATVTYYVLDDVIDQKIFTRFLKEAGKFIGIGRFRPRTSGGFYGRYSVEDVQWIEHRDEEMKAA